MVNLYPSLRNILWKHSNHGVFFVEDLWRFPVENGEVVSVFQNVLRNIMLAQMDN